MAKYLRYQGEFLTHDGHTVRVELLQEHSTPYTPVEVSFPAASPLVIEWPETDKLTPVYGSTATLTMISDSDRQFLDLYDASYGEVQLVVKRDGSLYWSGTLDPEGANESYAFAANYDVQLTFSDFGILNRRQWSRTGLETFDAILSACITAAGINYGQLIRSISTKDQYGSDINWSTDVILANDNFYDEEDEPMTVFAVLEAILQPFAMRIIQRSGNIYLYDLNALHSGQATRIDWSVDENSVLSRDVVYNNAKITFSPYASKDVVAGEVSVKTRNGNGTLIRTSYAPSSDDYVDGFTIRHGSTSLPDAAGLTLGNGVAFFDMDAEYSGQDCSGVLWGYKRGDYALNDSYRLTQQVLNAAGSCYNTDMTAFRGQLIATTRQGYLPYVSTVYEASSHYRLRINLDLLMDVRYNPFESEGPYNEEDNCRLMQRCRFVYVPVMVTLRDSSGTALYHLENSGMIFTDQYRSSRHMTRWVSGEGQPGCCYLAYYDQEDRKNKTGLGGWATNRRIIGHYYDELPESWKMMPAGEYVSLPPTGGYLEMKVYSGALIWYKSLTNDLFPYFRWVAYKDPSICIVKKNGNDIDMEDQEDDSYLSADSEETLSIDTVFGTLSEKCFAPTARGKILSATSIHPRFTRANVTDRLEKLLLGTVYSQYATRKAKLSGSAKIIGGALSMTDANTSGKFLVMADSQDLIDDTSDVTLVAYESDSYAADGN